MSTERHAILQLVAVGRISPAEAERLLIAWNEGRETIWALAACAVITAITQFDPLRLSADLVQVAHRLLPVVHASVQHFVSCFQHLLGGVL